MIDNNGYQAIGSVNEQFCGFLIVGILPEEDLSTTTTPQVDSEKYQSASYVVDNGMLPENHFSESDFVKNLDVGEQITILIENSEQNTEIL